MSQGTLWPFLYSCLLHDAERQTTGVTMEKLGMIAAIVGVVVVFLLGAVPVLYNDGCGPLKPVSIQIDGQCRPLYARY